MPTSLASSPVSPMSSTCTVTPLTAATGAVVVGLDLAAPLDPATVDALADLVADRGMVALPGQRLDAAAHLALASRFGPLAVSPLPQLLGSNRSISTIEDTAERPPAGFDWHTDESWTVAPPALGFLHAVTIPPTGGDTIWANGTAAFDRLPSALQRLAVELDVVHHMGDDYLRTVVRHHGRNVADALEAAHPPIAHPLVRVHERTGRPALWLSPLYHQRLVGFDDATSRALLDLFGRTLEDPHVQVRWRWSQGDVVIWDETATTHRALVDHYPAHRVMRRCTTQGHAPIPPGDLLRVLVTGIGRKQPEAVTRTGGSGGS